MSHAAPTPVPADDNQLIAERREKLRALREAQATGYAREKMYGIWWAGSDHDVKDIGAGAKGYNVVTIHNTAEHDKVHEEVKAQLYD